MVGSNTDLYFKSLAAQIKFVADNIQTPGNKEAYLDAMETINEVSQLGNNLREIEVLLMDSARGIKSQWSFWAKPTKYTRLAYKHALDITRSLQTRFEQGGSSVYFLGGKIQ